jgi:hypothetical protein
MSTENQGDNVGVQTWLGQMTWTHETGGKFGKNGKNEKANFGELETKERPLISAHDLRDFVCKKNNEMCKDYHYY